MAGMVGTRVQPASAGAASGNIVPVSVKLDPSSGTPSSIGHEDVLDAGMFGSGDFEMYDPAGRATAVSDNGTACDIVANSGGGELSSSAGQFQNPWIRYKHALMGDVEIIAQITSSGGNALKQFGLIVGSGDTSTEGGNVTYRFGRASATLGQRVLYSIGNSSTKSVTVASNVDYADRWCRLKIVANEIEAYDGGTGSSPSWTKVAGPKKWDRAGGHRYAGVIWRAGANDDKVGIKYFELIGTRYVADPE